MAFSYLAILLVSLSYPIFKTFGKPLYLTRISTYLISSIVIVSLIFIAWDHYFTEQGYWGFNNDYVLGLYLFNLPVEEVLFFLIIPYCCMFIYEVVRYLFGDKIKNIKTGPISTALLALFLIMFIIGIDQKYTSWASAYAMLSLILTMIFRKSVLPRFYVSFLFVLIPFFVVNGILTGTGPEQPIVWYNDEEILGIRALTIPLEDFVYCFGMLLSITLIYELFNPGKRLTRISSIDGPGEKSPDGL